MKNAAMAQVVEHILGKDEVGSSSLPSSSKEKALALQVLFLLYAYCVRYRLPLTRELSFFRRKMTEGEKNTTHSVDDIQAKLDDMQTVVDGMQCFALVMMVGREQAPALPHGVQLQGL